MSALARFAVAVLAVLAALTVSLGLALPAQAAGTPDLNLDASATKPLYGESSAVSVSASLPAGEPRGYNLSFRVVLPEGVSYAGGAEFTPQILSDAPDAGKTTLIFSNISDLTANSTQAVEFEVEHDPDLYDVGDTYGIEYEAFVNSDPRYVPDFDAAGVSVPGSYTGSAQAETNSKITAIRIKKDEPSREGEILRGVHDHQTVYTLRLQNNFINPTDDSFIDDYLPAGLEFLGCEEQPDSTTEAPTNPGSAEEYPGSGAIDVQSVDDCHEPVLVKTVQTDPDGPGPMPNAIYTHVRWDVGLLDPGQEVVYSYRAAVPLAENTLDWTGPEPAAESGQQAANLDNNSGPEVRDEQELTNYAIGSGAYQGEGGPVDVDDDTTLTRTAEDLVVYKSTASGELAQAQINTWELRFRTGEYRYSDGIVVTDTLPSGLCPLGEVNHTTGNGADDAECDPTGDLPSVPYESVTENADGTFTIVWDQSVLPKLGHTDVSDEFTITFPTRTRAAYQSNFDSTTPILARDKVSNKVDLTADAFSRCTDPGSADCATPGPRIWADAGQPEPVVDKSSAGQQAPGVKLLKEVADSGTDCETATYGQNLPSYRPGDVTCWRLTIEFPGKVDTNELGVTDFLPRSAVYVPGSYEDTAGNTTINSIDTSKAGGGVLTWDISGGYVDSGSQVFQVTFKTKHQPTGVLPPVDIEGNLLKFSFANTSGQSFPLRDLVQYKVTAPGIELKKGVRQIDSGTVHDPAVDNLTVRGGNVVTYQIDLESNGDNNDIQVWDKLPAAFDCSMVSDITDGGSCVDGGSGADRIKWTVPAIADGDSKALNYKVAIPGTFGPENNYVNKAGVRQFESETNTGEEYLYTPQDNIDPDNPKQPNTGPADDVSNVRTPNVGLSKDRTTSIDETGNNAASQATIGELIDYTVTATLPNGTTFGTDAKITDTPDSASTQPIVGSATAQLNGAPLPAGWSVSTVGQTVTVNIPDGYEVPNGPDHVVTIHFRTRVTDVAANVRGQKRTNRANIAWKDGSSRSRNSNTVSTTIVEPRLAQAKANDSELGESMPGDVVTYTVTTSNQSGGNASIAHDTLIRDAVPAGVTLIDDDGNPLADGAEVPGTDGATWDADTRTISGGPVDIDPGAGVTWTYRATIDTPAPSGKVFVNQAEAETTSIDGSDPGERSADSPTNGGYTARSSSKVKVGGSFVAKSVTPDWVTIGDQLTFKVRLTIPAEIDHHNLTAIDRLPDSLDFDSYTGSSCVEGCSGSNPAPTVQAYDPEVTASATRIGWDLGHVAPGTADRVVEFTYKAHVRDTHRASGAKVVAGENIVNVVRSFSNASDEYDFDPGEFQEESAYDHRSPEAKTTTPVREPKLVLDKQVDPGSGFVDGPITGNPDDSLTYRIVITNTGSSAAWDLVVDDQPDVELTDVALDQGAAWNTDPWSAADPDMRWVIPGPVAPGESVTLTYTAKIRPLGDLSPDNPAINTAAAAYQGLPDSERNNPWDYRDYETNEDKVRVDIHIPITDLKIDKSAPAEIAVGEEFDYTLKVTNKGPDPATQVVIDDPLPNGLVFVSSDDCTTAVSCDLGGIAPHQSKTVTFRVKATIALANKTVTNTAHVSGYEYEPTPEDNTDDAKTLVKIPDVVIEKTAAPTDAQPGDVVTYTLKARNDGLAPAHGVVVTDTLPAGLSFVSADAPCVEAGGTVTCEVGTLAPGQEVAYQVKVKVEPWGTPDPSQNHQLDVQKVEAQIDLDPGQTRTVEAICPSGYFATDGSVRIDHVDQGTGDWTAPRVLESRASAPGTWRGTVKNTATGRAQAKVFAVCVQKKTVVDGGHQHELIISEPITVSGTAAAGANEAVLECGPGQIAIQPGYLSEMPGDLIYSQPEGRGWKFVLDLEQDADVTFSIRCMTRQVTMVDGHVHDLDLKRIWTEVEIQPGTVNEAQLTCADGSKGIVAGWDLDPGLVSLGNDPRPVTRAFKLYNPTDEPLKARLSLLCLGLRTGGEQIGTKTYDNTAYVTTTSDELDTTNNSSTATVTAGDGPTDDPIVDDPDPEKPHPNNPIAKTIVGKGALYSARTVMVKLRCSGPCRGTAKLTTLRRIKVKGKRYRKGVVLARKRYVIGQAGTKRVKLKLTRRGRVILKKRKARKALLRISGGTRKVVKVRRHRR